MISTIELLQKLIQFETVNPPGNEHACVMYINELLTNAGIQTTVVAKDPNRPNLLARLPGRGEAPPLLLQGHVDVVTVADQQWTHPPFEAKIVDGWMYGRGTLDMKGAVAMMVKSFLEAAESGRQPAGDILLLILADEEAGAEYGARYIVEEHAGLLEGVKYSLGEMGGFPIKIGDKKFYLMQVSEKQTSQWKIRITDRGGHGGFPMRNGTMAKVGHVLSLLNKNALPVHITKPTQLMLDTIIKNVSFPVNAIMRLVKNPTLSSSMINLLGEELANIEPMLRNTINATMIKGGHKINVIPSEVIIELDGRMLPGMRPDDLKRQVMAIAGEYIDEMVCDYYDPGPDTVDMGLFNLLSDVMSEADPSGIPLPYLMPLVTDARFFARLGIQNYGFTPLNLPEGFNFSATIHAADERLPVTALDFGTQAFAEVFKRYRG